MRQTSSVVWREQPFTCAGTATLLLCLVFVVSDSHSPTMDGLPSHGKLFGHHNALFGWANPSYVDVFDNREHAVGMIALLHR